LSLVAAIVLTACSSPQCEADSGCNDQNACTIDKCNAEGLCAHRKIAGCTCGDQTCDPKINENSCTCPTDCGPCTGAENPYVEKYCADVNGKQTCVSGVPPSKIDQKSISDKIDTRKFVMTATYYYDNPFDVSRAVFNVHIVLDKLNTGVKQPKITKIKVLEKLDRRGRELNILGEKEVDKVLWSKDTTIDEDIILDKVSANMTPAEKSLTVKMSYEYLTTVRGEDVVNTGDYEKQLSDPITLLGSGPPSVCPSSCDDQNSCTRDYCQASTDYFCAHDLLNRACCGNNVCDAGENTCLCPEDCGSCDQLVGEYVEYACVDDACVTRLRDAAVVEPITLIDSNLWSDFKIDTKTTFNKPFSIKDDVFTIGFELINKKEGVRDILIKKAQMTDGNELLGEITFAKAMDTVGTIQIVKLPMNFVKNIADEEEKNLRLKIYYDYQPPPNSKGEYGPKRINQIYTISYSKVIFVNPEV